MPKNSVEELRALIVQGRIGGIAIDTSIFDRSGCNLESPTLVSVAELTPRHVTVVMPDIIVGEVRNHIIRDVRLAVDHARKSLRMIEKSRGSARGRSPEQATCSSSISTSAGMRTRASGGSSS